MMLPGCLRFFGEEEWLFRAPHGLSLPSLVVRLGIICKPVDKEAKEMAVLSWLIPHTVPRSPVQPHLLSSSQGADIPDLAPSLTHRFSAAESQLQPPLGGFPRLLQVERVVQTGGLQNTKLSPVLGLENVIPEVQHLDLHSWTSSLRAKVSLTFPGPLIL